MANKTNVTVADLRAMDLEQLKLLIDDYKRQIGECEYLLRRNPPTKRMEQAIERTLNKCKNDLGKCCRVFEEKDLARFSM